MFRFAIKKTFFDLWDHLFFALAVNLAFTLIVLGLASLAAVVQSFGAFGGLVVAPLPFLVAALLGGPAHAWARDIAFEGSARFSDFWTHWKATWTSSLLFGVAWLIVFAGFLFGVPFYHQLNEIAGFGFGIVMIWVTFFFAGMSLYYPGLQAQIESRLPKLAKKSFVLFLAHPWTSLSLFVGLVLCVALSILTLGFFPGIVGIGLWLQVTFKFLMAKYDWLEAHSDADPKRVPWSEIVRDDMDKVGPRSLKSLIFPWKD